MSNVTAIRATHSGTWYNAKSSLLVRELEAYLNVVQDRKCRLKALISPHASYKYSGGIAAYGFKQINTLKFRTIFLIGFCHNIVLKNCAIPETNVDTYNTPLGPLSIDTEITNKLSKSKLFQTLPPTEFEKEHSIEMQLPYIKVLYHIKNRNKVFIVPMFISKMDKSYGQNVARLLLEYFEKPDTLFIFTSDFCHYGRHYSFVNLPPVYDNISINVAIECMDRAAIRCIENHNIEGFENHLNTTKNTICGRYPIYLFLMLANMSKYKLKTELLRYIQSSRIGKKGDNCVSYASIITKLDDE